MIMTMKRMAWKVTRTGTHGYDEGRGGGSNEQSACGGDDYKEDMAMLHHEWWLPFRI